DGTTDVLTSGLVFSSSAPATIGVAGGTVQALAAGSAVVTVSRSGVPPVQVAVSVDTGADAAPTVTFLAPAAGAGFERGETVTVSARAQDDVGVVAIRLTASGAASHSETLAIAPPATTANRSLAFTI